MRRRDLAGVRRRVQKTADLFFRVSLRQVGFPAAEGLDFNWRCCSKAEDIVAALLNIGTKLIHHQSGIVGTYPFL